MCCSVSFVGKGGGLLLDDAEHVLFNLPTATTVNIQGVGLLGSLLAPLADVHFNSGNIDGTLIANNLDGYGESHLHLFQGNLPTPPVPPPPSVPLPASALGGTALLTVLAARRARKA